MSAFVQRWSVDGPVVGTVSDCFMTIRLSVVNCCAHGTKNDVWNHPNIRYQWAGIHYLWILGTWKIALTWDFFHRSNIFTIFEGTSEIQQLIIARAISGVHIQ